MDNLLRVPATESVYDRINRGLIDFVGGEASLLYNELKKVNVITAGGAILSLYKGTEINDLDLFPETTNDLNYLLQIIDNYNRLQNISKLYRECDTHNAITYILQNKTGQEVKIQVIRNTAFLGTPLDIINRFDLNVCKAFYKFKDNSLYLSNYWYAGVITNKLEYNYKSNSLALSLMRIEKYKKRGFEFSKENTERLISTLEDQKLLEKAQIKLQKFEKLDQYETSKTKIP